MFKPRPTQTKQWCHGSNMDATWNAERKQRVIEETIAHPYVSFVQRGGITGFSFHGLWKIRGTLCNPGEGSDVSPRWWSLFSEPARLFAGWQEQYPHKALGKNGPTVPSVDYSTVLSLYRLCITDFIRIII